MTNRLTLPQVGETVYVVRDGRPEVIGVVTSYLDFERKVNDLRIGEYYRVGYAVAAVDDANALGRGIYSPRLRIEEPQTDLDWSKMRQLP